MTVLIVFLLNSLLLYPVTALYVRVVEISPSVDTITANQVKRIVWRFAYPSWIINITGGDIRNATFSASWTDPNDEELGEVSGDLCDFKNENTKQGALAAVILGCLGFDGCLLVKGQRVGEDALAFDTDVFQSDFDRIAELEYLDVTADVKHDNSKILILRFYLSEYLTIVI